MTANVLMGIGNEMRGDDGIGVYVAKNFKKEGWKVIVAGQVPEDFTGEIKRLKPEKLVLVDAALMGLDPGEIRIVPVEKISDVAFSTHGMPLSFFISYLKGFVGKIVLIGIQPERLEFGESLSENVIEAGKRLIEIIHQENEYNLKTL